MMGSELSNFFEQANKDLESLINYEDTFNYETQKEFNIWKANVVSKLNGAYKIKINRLNIFFMFEPEFGTLAIDDNKLNMLKTVLRDMYFKYNINKKKSKENIEILKLLKAREENIDFELELAKRTYEIIVIFLIVHLNI